MQRALRRIPPGVLLACLVVVAAGLLYLRAARVHVYSPDEEFFVDLSRVLAEHFPGGIVDVPEVEHYSGRGIQRLLLLVLAGPLGVIGGPAGFALAHALLCLIFASAAIPAYLLARGVRLSAPWALAAAALVVAVPWAVLSLGWLTEPVAYPAAVWVLWGAWRACLYPGWRADLLAVALVLLAGLARTSLLVLIVVPPGVVLLHAALTGRGRHVRRDHPLLSAFALVGAAVVLVSILGGNALGGLAGGYRTSLPADWSPLPGKFLRQLAPIASGVGFVPAILALPWALRQVAVRRRDPEALALALVLLVALPALLISTIYAAPEERYLMYMAPPIIVAGVAALARRDVPAWSVAVSALVVAILVEHVAWPFVADAARFQTDPALSFLSRVPLMRVSDLALALAVVAAGVLLAVVVARRSRRAALAVLAVLFGLQLVQTAYITGKRAEATEGPAGIRERTWVDRAAEGRPVAMQAEGQANSGGYEAAWRDAQFFNGDIEVFASTDPRPKLLVARHATIERVTVDAATGVLATASGRRLPRLWLVPTLFRPMGLVEQPLETSKYLPLRLVRLRGAPRAAWRWSGVEPDGWIGKGRPDVALRVYPGASDGPGRRCLRITLVSAPNYPGVHRYRVRAPGVDVRGALRAEGRAAVTVPLTPAVRTIRVQARGTTEFVPGRELSMLVGATETIGC